MLELEVVPERSLGCEQWEFILGKFFLKFLHLLICVLNICFESIVNLWHILVR